MKVRHSISIDEKLLEKLKKDAEKQKRTLSSVICEAIEAFVKRKANQKFV